MLERLAREAGQDPALGFTRQVVLEFLEEHSNRLGKDVGWKIFCDGQVVSERHPEDKKTPFVGFVQKAGHMYLFSKTSAINKCHENKKRQLHIGVRQYERALSDIPYEMRTKFLAKDPGAALALWRLKVEKRTRDPKEAR